jgi:CRP-like cAMP-binding protein
MDSRIVDRLTWLLEEQDVFAGDTLFSEGDPAETFYFLRDGGVRLIRPGSAPLTLESPTVVGLFDAVFDRPRPRTAVVTADTQVMSVRIDDWLDLLEDSFELTRVSVLGAARRVARLEEQLLQRGIAPWVPASSVPQPLRRPLGVLERLALLMDALPFRRAGVQTLSDLALAAAEQELAPGDVLLSQGSKPDCVFLVLQGEVEATGPHSSLQWTFGPGHIVCGTAAFTDAVRGWSARAKSQTLVLAFRIEDWFDVMEEHFDLVRSALAGLALEHERLLDLVAGPVSARDGRTTDSP